MAEKTSELTPKQNPYHPEEWLEMMTRLLTSGEAKTLNEAHQLLVARLKDSWPPAESTPSED